MEDDILANLRKYSMIAGCTLLLLALHACRPAPGGWTPVLEETSTIFLRTETQRVVSRLHSARAALLSDPETAAAELAAAEASLEHLLIYYLPLLEARERAYNAYRYYYLDNPGQTTQELDAVETILLGIADTGRHRLVEEMQEPLERLEDARAALAAEPENASKALVGLATRLNNLLLKGGLVLTE